MGSESLEQAIARVGNPVELLRNIDYPAFTFPIAPEFTNWRSEQRAWRETVALLDQSHHMTDYFMAADDGLIELLGRIGANSFANFRPGIAKQLVAVNHDGYVIGDGILFHLGDRLDLVGHHLISDWVRYNIEREGLDIWTHLDGNSNVREGDPVLYRYQLQGPRANEVVEKLTGEPVPAVKFFHIHDFSFAGTTVRGLRHGMAGEPGFEFFGPYAEGERVRDAILEAGREFGILPVGAKGYSSTPLESGWVPTPFPAIFGEEFREYREWLPLARAGNLAGSLYSENVEDYYLTPYDLGLGRSVKFDHDFIGKEALQKIAEAPQKRKVTLIWNADDVAEAVKSQITPGTPAKFIDFPKSRYGLYQFDAVLDGDRRVGASTDAGYVTYDQLYMSLASVDEDVAQDGQELVVLWGEDPISDKAIVERHRQVRIRATVAPAPYHEYARTTYRANP
ncbi:aminomethyltransferase family protein [Georgenia halophila]|uniref:Aminomethyltransferase family protein n=1 Tax=Georgenia halophila TaxID=620889 RepID=A0ABP8KTI7_9MICO